jgi:hypothetical protein
VRAATADTCASTGKPTRASSPCEPGLARSPPGALQRAAWRSHRPFPDRAPELLSLRPSRPEPVKSDQTAGVNLGLACFRSTRSVADDASGTHGGYTHNSMQPREDAGRQHAEADTRCAPARRHQRESPPNESRTARHSHALVAPIGSLPVPAVRTRKNPKTLRFGGLFYEAAEGTRTLDLLHGKQTL